MKLKVYILFKHPILSDKGLSKDANELWQKKNPLTKKGRRETKQEKD